MLPLWLMSCEMQRNEAPAQRVTLPVSIYLPAEEMQSAYHSPVRRTPGDPGTYEQLTFPNHLYIIILKQVGENWVLWHKIDSVVTDESWKAKSYVGLLYTPGDSIYEFTHEFDLLLNSEKFNGRIYAIASSVALTFNQSLGSIASLSDAEDLTFDASSQTVQNNLQHIYSTPYNYEVSDDYFGAFTCIKRVVPHVNLLLYHVAAKVDITWSVDDEKRYDKVTPGNGVRLTSMKACNLFNGNAYCFKPMMNSSGATPLTPSAGTGDTITIVRPTDEGLWWEGRSYFYTILYTTTEGGKENYFPLQMEMETNRSGAKYRPTIYMQIDKTSPFVPWMRATFNLNNPLTAGTDEKMGS